MEKANSLPAIHKVKMTARVQNDPVELLSGNFHFHLEKDGAG